jgi:hypothetical protein
MTLTGKSTDYKLGPTKSNVVGLNPQNAPKGEIVGEDGSLLGPKFGFR